MIKCDRLKKNTLTTFCAFVTSLLFLGGLGSSAHGATQPNIIFIFIDDIGWGDLSCYGSPVTNKLGQPITPNLDNLAAQGIRFTQGYVASPICSPSRTGVLTGINPARYAIYSFLNNKANNASRNMNDWLQPHTVTSPRLFQQAGYKTGQFGKWHMGNGRDVNDAPPPSAYGFEESLVAFEGNGDRLGYWNDNGSKDGLSQANEDATVGTQEYVYWYQAADRHTDRALTFMTNAVIEGKPFFLHVPYNDTHSPYNVPPGQANDFDHITSDTDGKLFLGELHNLDKQIGRIMATVDGLGIATNTLIIAIGDNGAPNDALETLLNRNGGLKLGKGNLTEGGIRVPFIARWTGTVPAGVVNTNTAISTLDLLPTYCSIAGIPLPNAPFAGENMRDVFMGSTRSRVRPLLWEYGTVSGISSAAPKLAIRDGNYKFMRNPDGSGREFYLIPQDSSESNNRVNNGIYTSVITNLEAQLMTWYNDIVLGNVGETYPCETNGFTGLVIADTFNVSGGNSPGSGFGANSGVNYQYANRLTGGAATNLIGYRYGAGGRVTNDFSIVGNRLEIAPRNANGRFEFSSDGISGFDFGSFLSGGTYELSVQMNIATVGTSYAQRMSISLADVSSVAVQEADLGLQIGTDGSGGLLVAKRVDAASNSGGADINSTLISGLPIGSPISLTLRVSDYNVNVSNYSSTYEILVNGISRNTGVFRFNNSTTSRYLIFDVAAHEGPVQYENLQLTVTNSGSIAMCRRHELNVSDVRDLQTNPKIRLYWTSQPGVTVFPEVSTNLSHWTAMTNALGNPLSVITDHGTIQWLEVAAPLTTNQGSFIRLRQP